jgi:hypothetical protein
LKQLGPSKWRARITFRDQVTGETVLDTARLFYAESKEEAINQRAAMLMAYIRAREVASRPKYNGVYTLYLLEIIGVGVKVGISLQPNKRFSQHVTAAKAHNRDVGRRWTSPPHLEARANEKAIRAGRRTEYLPIGWEEALSLARRLPMTQVGEETHAA